MEPLGELVRSSRQRSFAVGLGLLVLLVGAWWWFDTSELAEPVTPAPPASIGSRGEVAPAGSAGSAALGSTEAEERLPVALPAEPPGPTVVVRAVDAFGLPVEGAQVLVRGESDTVGQPFGRSGADGTCKVALAAAAQFVRAHDEKVGTSIEVRITAAATNDEPLVLPLLRPVVVRGRVVLRDEPVGMVRVQVHGELRLARPDPGTVVPPYALEVSGPDRSFSFEAAVGALLKFGASDERNSLVPEQEVVAAAGLEVVLVADGAPRRYEIHGLLLDADSVPLVGREFGGFSSGMRPYAWVRAGSQATPPGVDGRFVLHVDEPSVVVQGFHGNTSSAKVLCEFGPGRHRADVVLKLRPNVHTKGRVVGVMSSDWNLQAVEVGEDLEDSFRIPLSESGEFQFDFPEGSRWRLSAGGEAVEVRAGQQDVEVVAPAPTIDERRFELVHDDGREPLFPWAEWWHLEGERLERAPARFECKDGQATVWSLRQAPWRLVVLDGASAAHLTIEPNAHELGRVFLQAPAKLTARVRRAGAPMRGLDVVMECCGPLETSRGDGAGRHHFAQLPHGPAFVHVRRGAEVLATQRVELFPGQTTEVSFDLP